MRGEKAIVTGRHIFGFKFWLVVTLIWAFPSWAAQSLEPDPLAEINRDLIKEKVLKLGKAAQVAYDQLEILPAVEASDKISVIVKNEADKNAQDSAGVYKSYAFDLHKAGFFFAAEQLFYSAYRINATEVGEYHPFTLSSLNNLASNLNAQERFADAATHYEKVLRFRTLILGSRHSATIDSLANLGYTYNRLGLSDKARDLLDRAVNLSIETRGRDHPESAKLMVLFADILGNREDAPKSEAYLREALKTLTAVNGPYHVDTMSCLQRLGTNLFEQKKYSEAEPYFYHAWTRRQNKLGKDDRATEQSKESLIASLNSQGLYEEAEKIFGTGVLAAE